MTYESVLVSQYLENIQIELRKIGLQLKTTAEELIADQRVGNFTAPDHIEVIFKLIDPNGHDVSRDPGKIFIGGVPASARVANYAITRTIPEPLRGRTVMEIVKQGENELDDLQRKLVQFVTSLSLGAENYVRNLTRFTALYFAANQPPLESSVNYDLSFESNFVIRGFYDKPLILGHTQSGLVEIAPGLRGVASVQSISKMGIPFILIDSNPYVVGILKDYAEILNTHDVKPKLDDAKSTKAIHGYGTVVATGLHHLPNSDIIEILTNISNSLPTGGKLYFRDSECENPGMREVVIDGLNHTGLKIIHYDNYLPKKGFEFVAEK